MGAFEKHLENNEGSTVGGYSDTRFIDFINQMQQFIWLVLTIIDAHPRYAILYFVSSFPIAFINGLEEIENKNTVKKWLCGSKTEVFKKEQDIEEPPISKTSIE